MKCFETRFKISNHGRLISIGGKFGGEVVLSLYIDSFGYYCATLRMKPHKRKVRIHTLVCEHFISEKPSGKRITVNHKDGNKLNNYFENLEWIEQSDNVRHAVAMGLMDFKGEKHHNSKLKKEDILKMRKLFFEEKKTHKQIGELFGVCRRHAGDIIHGVNWGWVS